MRAARRRKSCGAHGLDCLRAALARDTLALPPAAARAFYFADCDLAYSLSGYGDLLFLREHVELNGACVLDFGCSSGRGAPPVRSRSPRGADRRRRQRPRCCLGTRASAVHGRTEHLIPSLPLGDASVELVHAGSVITHINETEQAWLLELRRVLRPGGTALVSFHPERSWPDMRDPAHPIRSYVESMPHRAPTSPRRRARIDGRPPQGAERVVFTAIDYPSSNANVIHSHAYVREHWGRLFGVEGFVRRTHGAQQDFVILRRPY